MSGMTMNIPPSFPVLPGQAWSVHKRPTFATRVAPHVSGREVRRANYAAALYEFEVSFDGLASSGFAGLGASSLQALMGFYLACQGQLGTFLYADPSDDAVAGQPIGVGDGTTTTFTFARSLGGATEPVGWVTGLGNVYLGGVAQASSATAVAQPNTLVFATAPAAGIAITADFTYAFVCRFLDDSQDFENVASGLWQLGSLKFRSVRTS